MGHAKSELIKLGRVNLVKVAELCGTIWVEVRPPVKAYSVIEVDPGPQTIFTLTTEETPVVP
jgi:hypothetical protein